MGRTSIEWTRGDDGADGVTWNPVRGCTKISPGCTHCYAETFAERWRGIKGHPYEQGFDLRLVPEKLGEPLRWKKPKRVFVNSMSDLFHEDVPDEYLDKVFAVMALCPQHTFQVLTKRAERMQRYIADSVREGGRWDALIYNGDFPWPDGVEIECPSILETATVLPNVWLGVSVENKKHGLPRIVHLLQTPAAVRFLSIEPLLEDLGAIDTYLGQMPQDEDGAPYPGPLHWVIVGCESGHKRRPMQTEWAESIADECKEAGVPFFMKQMCIDGKVTGQIERFPERLRVRQFPETSVPA